MNTQEGVRVALYARISEDVTGHGLKVADQMERCRQLADERGWTVVAELADNDISALKGDYRPGYAEVLRLVRLRQIDHVVVWQSSRLLRNRSERAEAIELFGRQRVGIVAVKGISFDLATAYGRGQAGLLGEFDTMESEVKQERVAAAAAERAQRGRPSGTLGYGWTQDGTGKDATWTVDTRQAAIVREIIDRLLAGESLHGITADLNRRGEPAPKHAARWGKTSVKKLALRESNIAVRVHHRGRPTEARYVGCWPAIVDRDKHDRVRALLTDPSRRTNSGVIGQEQGIARPGARRHLLSWGVGECGVCGTHLRVSSKKGRYGQPTVLYVCEDGCVGRNEAHVDYLVRAVVIDRMSRPDALQALLGDDDEAGRWHEKADAIRARLDDAADSFALGEITRAQLVRITARLEPDLRDALDQAKTASALLDVDAFRPLVGPRAEEAWDGMSVAQRRAVLEALGMRVLVDRTSHRGPTPRDADGHPVVQGIRIEWRA